MLRLPSRAVVVTFTLVLIVGAILLSAATRITPHVRDRTVAALNARFQSEVALDSLQVSVFPRPEVNGAGLVLRHNGRTDVPPLIQISSYTASAGLWGLFSSPLRLRTVELEGLAIRIPPGGLKQAPKSADPPPTETAPPAAARDPDGLSARLVIDRIVARAARLEIVPRDPAKLPRVFEIHNLVMHDVGKGAGAPFEASLTNPTPRGVITTRGTFGPWFKEEPSLTPVRGEYVFRDANLNTIRGISGTLSSTGSYAGPLDRIEVKGETDTPDFSIDVAAQPVPLKTRFQAVVDGTNGNTTLERVEARLAETEIVARGAVERTEDVKGRQTSLKAQIADGRIEDVLRLAVKSRTPLMTGRMRLDTAFLLPAGDRPVSDKLQLDGHFKLERARFTSVDVQEKIDTLSRRGKGVIKDQGASVVSNFSGTFKLRSGRLSFSTLTFAVPGAIVQLAGTLDLDAEVLDFTGDLLLDASLAQTTTGIKSVLARLAQPFFRRPGGGSKLPIRISGSLSKPAFGLDVRRALTPGK